MCLSVSCLLGLPSFFIPFGRFCGVDNYCVEFGNLVIVDKLTKLWTFVDFSVPCIFFDTFRAFLCGVDNYCIEFGNPVIGLV